jgi:hypothetical protein
MATEFSTQRTWKFFLGTLNNPVVRANLRAFDFNNDEVIDDQDLAALRAKVPASK